MIIKRLANADKWLGQPRPRRVSSTTCISEEKPMSSEIKALVRSHQGDSNAQIWIIGTRDQVIHLMNELYVKKVATDRAQFTPIIPAPFSEGKVMSVLTR